MHILYGVLFMRLLFVSPHYVKKSEQDIFQKHFLCHMKKKKKLTEQITELLILNELPL